MRVTVDRRAAYHRAVAPYTAADPDDFSWRFRNGTRPLALWFPLLQKPIPVANVVALKRKTK